MRASAIRVWTFEYGPERIHTASHSLYHHLFILQHSALRFFTFVTYRVRYTTVYIIREGNTCSFRRRLNYTFECLAELKSSYSWFPISFHNRNLRNLLGFFVVVGVIGRLRIHLAGTVTACSLRGRYHIESGCVRDLVPGKMIIAVCVVHSRSWRFRAQKFP